MIALFDLDAAGAVVDSLPCGHHVDPIGQGDEHETVCLNGVCPFCLAPDGGYYVWLHHNPRGYRDAGYCATQRSAFEQVAECAACRCFTFGALTCHNSACPLGRESQVSES